MEFGMSHRIKPKEKYVRISMKEVWRNFDGPSENKEFVELRSDFEFSRPKVVQDQQSSPCDFSFNVITNQISSFIQMLDKHSSNVLFPRF